MRLDVAGAGTSNGTNVQLYQTNENAAQQWELIYVGAYIVDFVSGFQNIQKKIFIQ